MAVDLKILKSLYGRRLGLNRAGSLIMDGREVVGGPLSMATMIRDYEHFTGPVLSTSKWAVLKGSDGSAVNPAITVAAGGKVRLTNASAGTASMAVGGAQIVGARNWEMDKTAFRFGCGLQMSTLTNMSVFAGMTDKVTLEAAFSLSGSTETSNATDGFGFLYDDAATAKTWKFVGVANNVDTTILDTGVSPVAATDDVLSCSVDENGRATVWVNGNLIGAVDGVCTPSVTLTPSVSSWVRTTAAANTVDVDYVMLEISR